MKLLKENIFPGLLAFISGLGVCLAVSAIGNHREAWDSGLYYSAGIPGMCVLIFLISYFWFKRTWRWTLCMAAGQFLSGFIKGSDLSLWPLAMVFMTVVSIPQFIAGWMASRIASKRGNPPEKG